MKPTRRLLEAHIGGVAAKRKKITVASISRSCFGRGMADVRSPCTGVCRVDDASGWCTGCRRTLDEIAAWPALTNEARRAVLARLGGRRDAREPAASPRDQ